MTETEWQILDEVYLMASYRVIRDAINEGNELFDKTLIGLLEKGLLRQLVYNVTFKDYTDVLPYDVSRLKEAHYVITRQGLLEHTGAA
jgi:hypothetical protein